VELECSVSIPDHLEIALCEQLGARLAEYREIGRAHV
jgi:hypothetical protein